ncbi:MAG: class I SAM-dependent methyltransferase [Bdellovibrionales bacterium]
MDDFQFTNNWFDGPRAIWEKIIPQIKPAKILEIGTYEGASICYLIQKLSALHPLEIHCVDTWEGGELVLNPPTREQMAAAESRFRANTKIAIGNAPKPVDLVVHKGRSDEELAKLISDGKNGYFDFIYVDGSHQAPDVLCDALLSFRLLKVGGIMAFDDYLWAENLPQGRDPVRCPKPAIDAFTNIYCRKIQILPAPVSQIYIQKTSD